MHKQSFKREKVFLGYISDIKDKGLSLSNVLFSYPFICSNNVGYQRQKSREYVTSVMDLSNVFLSIIEARKFFGIFFKFTSTRLI